MDSLAELVDDITRQPLRFDLILRCDRFLCLPSTTFEQGLELLMCMVRVHKSSVLLTLVHLCKKPIKHITTSQLAFIHDEIDRVKSAIIPLRSGTREEQNAFQQKKIRDITPLQRRQLQLLGFRGHIFKDQELRLAYELADINSCRINFAAYVFAVGVSDGIIAVNDDVEPVCSSGRVSHLTTIRYFRIMQRLPIELQMHIAVGTIVTEMEFRISFWMHMQYFECS